MVIYNPNHCSLCALVCRQAEILGGAKFLTPQEGLSLHASHADEVIKLETATIKVTESS